MKKCFLILTAVLCVTTIFAKDGIAITSGDFTCLNEKGKKAIATINWTDAQVVKYSNNEENIEENLGLFYDFIASKDTDAMDNLVIKPHLQKQYYGKEWINIQIEQAQAKMKKGAEPIVLWEPSMEEIRAKRKVYYQFFNASRYNNDNKKAMQFLMQRDSASVCIPEGWMKENDKMRCLYDNLKTQDYDYLFTIHIDTIDMGNAVASEASAIMLGRVMKGKIGGAILKGTLTCIDSKTNEIIATADLNRVKGFGSSFDVDRIQSALITIFYDIKAGLK